MPGNLTKPAAREALVKAGHRPRLLDLDLAAAYVGLSSAVFARRVAEGDYPKPLAYGSRRQWDVRALDAAIDRLSGLAASSPADESEEAIQRAIDAYDPAST
jgi:predicted DNA-binding transcriptional regulator AlpA